MDINTRIRNFVSKIQQQDNHSRRIMNLANLANRNYTEPGRIAYNAAMYIAVEEHQGKDIIVCRPHPALLQNEEFIEVFKQQGKRTSTYTNPRCLRYLTYCEDERGAFWIMSSGRFISLAKLVVDKPNVRLDEKWVDSTISSLIETVQYVNNLEQYQLELTPHSVMVTKDTHNTVTLMPPLNDFLPFKETLYSESDERIAPELFNIEEPDQRADIYGIGKIIEFLHPYPNLPYKYSKIVKKSTNEKVGARPKMAESMLKTINKRKKGGAITHILISVAVVLGFFALIFLFPWGNEQKHEIKGLAAKDSTQFNDQFNDGFNDHFDDGAIMNDPLLNISIESATEEQKDYMLNNYLHDTTYLSLDTAMSLSPEMRQHQKEMMILAAEKFRTMYKQQVRPVLEKVYTDANMQDQNKFMTAYNQANAQLLKIQETLTEQYKIDPSTANRIASEVFGEVADALKSKLTNHATKEQIMQEYIEAETGEQ